MNRYARPGRFYFAVDGPRNEDEAVLCRQVKDIVTGIDWKCEVKTLFRDKNLGCRKGVSEAVSWFFENEPEGIILEDDCLPSDSVEAFIPLHPVAEQILSLYNTTDDTKPVFPLPNRDQLWYCINEIGFLVGVKGNLSLHQRRHNNFFY